MIALASAVALSVALFVFYLAYVTLLAAKKSGRLSAAPLVVRATAYAVLVVAGVLDVLFNILVGTLLFAEPPRELLFTTRCERHMNALTWRGRLAKWFCESWLNPFEPGHCH